MPACRERLRSFDWMCLYERLRMGRRHPAAAHGLAGRRGQSRHSHTGLVFDHAPKLTSLGRDYKRPRIRASAASIFRRDLGLHSRGCITPSPGRRRSVGSGALVKFNVSIACRKHRREQVAVTSTTAKCQWRAREMPCASSARCIGTDAGHRHVARAYETRRTR
jgi:hypothetical protein